MEVHEVLLRIFVDTDEISVGSVDQKFVRVEENTFSGLHAVLEKERICRGLAFWEKNTRAGKLAQALCAHGCTALAFDGDLFATSKRHGRQIFSRREC